MSQNKDALTGKVFDGKYELLELIGRGAMGSVYKAKHQMMDRIVAIKVLQVGKFQGEELEEYLKRFEREAKTTSLIEHPHAITIHDYGIEDDLPYLVMQYVDGQSLRKVINQCGPLPFERVIGIITQIAGALSAAHKLDVIHRDLKPDNIMLCASDEGEDFVQVLDFGIAKVLSGDMSTTFTQAGEAVGTPRYISPEQAKAETVGPPTDIYSLAVITYEMLVGDTPFTADTAMSMLFKHVNEAPPPPREINPKLQIPASAEAVLLRALSKNPDHRPQDVKEFVQQLATCLLGDDTEKTDTSLSQQSPTALRMTATESGSSLEQVQRITMPILAVAGVLLLICIGAFARINSIPDTTVEETSTGTSTPLFAEKKGSATVTLSSKVQGKEDAKVLVTKAEKLLDEGALIPAEHAAQDALRIDPTYAPAHFVMGKIFVQHRIPRKAIRHVSRAVQLDPSNEEYKKTIRELERKLRNFVRDQRNSRRPRNDRIRGIRPSEQSRLDRS